MFYRINKEDGYIHGVVRGVGSETSNCSEEEYLAVKAILEGAPAAEDGFVYRLREDLEWEKCKMDDGGGA